MTPATPVTAKTPGTQWAADRPAVQDGELAIQCPCGQAMRLLARTEPAVGWRLQCNRCLRILAVVKDITSTATVNRYVVKELARDPGVAPHGVDTDIAVLCRETRCQERVVRSVTTDAFEGVAQTCGGRIQYLRRDITPVPDTANAFTVVHRGRCERCGRPVAIDRGGTLAAKPNGFMMDTMTGKTVAYHATGPVRCINVTGPADAMPGRLHLGMTLPGAGPIDLVVPDTAEVFIDGVAVPYPVRHAVADTYLQLTHWLAFHQDAGNTMTATLHGRGHAVTAVHLAAVVVSPAALWLKATMAKVSNIVGVEPVDKDWVSVGCRVDGVQPAAAFHQVEFDAAPLPLYPITVTRARYNGPPVQQVVGFDTRNPDGSPYVPSPIIEPSFVRTPAGPDRLTYRQAVDLAKAGGDRTVSAFGVPPHLLVNHDPAKCLTLDQARELAAKSQFTVGSITDADDVVDARPIPLRLLKNLDDLILGPPRHVPLGVLDGKVEYSHVTIPDDAAALTAGPAGGPEKPRYGLDQLTAAGVYGELFPLPDTGAVGSVAFAGPGRRLKVNADQLKELQAAVDMVVDDPVAGTTYRTHPPRPLTDAELAYDADYWLNHQRDLPLAADQDDADGPLLAFDRPQ